MMWLFQDPSVSDEFSAEGFKLYSEAIKGLYTAAKESAIPETNIEILTGMESKAKVLQRTISGIALEPANAEKFRQKLEGIYFGTGNINSGVLAIGGSFKDITETIQKEDSTPKFNIVDEQAVKKVSKFKERITTKKNTSDVNTLTSSLEKLGISNKEIIPTETFFKDNTDRDIKMISHGTNEYITKTCKAHCWWCRHSIPSEWHPLGIPLKKDKENTYTCDGLFCSFN